MPKKGQNKLCVHYELGVVERRPNGRCRLCRKAASKAANAKFNERYTEKRRIWNSNNKVKMRSYQNKHSRKEQGMVFGPGQSVLSMLAAQNGLCAICARPFDEMPSRHMQVDHDRLKAPGIPNVRGLLCLNCNVGLGNLKDSVNIMKSAIVYLKNTSSTNC